MTFAELPAFVKRPRTQLLGAHRGKPLLYRQSTLFEIASEAVAKGLPPLVEGRSDAPAQCLHVYDRHVGFQLEPDHRARHIGLWPEDMLRHAEEDLGVGEKLCHYAQDAVCLRPRQI